MTKYRADPDSYNIARYLRKYRITRFQYDRLVADAGGRCAVCGETPSGSRHESRLHIDHDHITEKVRGLLCGRCNKALGLAKDDVHILQAMINYLNER